MDPKDLILTSEPSKLSKTSSKSPNLALYPVRAHLSAGSASSVSRRSEREEAGIHQSDCRQSTSFNTVLAGVFKRVHFYAGKQTRSKRWKKAGYHIIRTQFFPLRMIIIATF